MLNYKLKANSLLEISIVIMIVGVLMMSTFKGFDLLHKVKLDALISNTRIVHASINEIDEETFKTNDENEIWQEIFNIGIISEKSLKTNIGLKICLIKNENAWYIAYKNNKNELKVIEKDAKYIKSQIPEIEINKIDEKYYEIKYKI